MLRVWFRLESIRQNLRSKISGESGQLSNAYFGFILGTLAVGLTGLGTSAVLLSAPTNLALLPAYIVPTVLAALLIFSILLAPVGLAIL